LASTAGSLFHTVLAGKDFFMNKSFDQMGRVFGKLSLVACFVAVVVAGSGCASPEKSDFLTGSPLMHQGKYVHSFWSDGKIDRQTLSKIYVEPVDISRIKDYSDLTASAAGIELKKGVVWRISAQTGWVTVETPELATTRMSLAITYFTLGSPNARAWGSQFGAGHAIVQIDGKVTDATTGKEIACFEDRQRNSGGIGWADVVDSTGDAGPAMVRRMLESISGNFVKELSESAR
jgi:hypothetical protein